MFRSAQSSRSIFLWTLLFLISFYQAQAIDSYEVKFEGNYSSETFHLLQSASQLLTLSESPPATTHGLRRRAEADIQNFIRVLHNHGYYNATIDLDYDFDRQPPLVVVKINTGPVYLLAEFQIVPAENSHTSFSYECLSLTDLGVTLRQAALPKTILAAEETLLNLMESYGYPFASIKKRDVVADQSAKNIHVTLYVDSGPLTYFGKTTLNSSKSCGVLPSFFPRKIFWKENEVYDPSKIAHTQASLEASGLFTSITITHAEAPLENGQLPISIDVNEGKHRSIGWGIGATTQRGFGFTTEWENRNFRGVGEKIGFKTAIWSNLKEGTLFYIKPDFMRAGQNLVWLAELQHESTKGFSETSLIASGILERRINDHTQISYGGMYKKLHDTRAEHKGKYDLLKVPLQIRWSNANNLLDPTEGQSMNIKLIPSWQFRHQNFIYCIATLVNTFYKALTADETYVFAVKSTFGSILGSNRRSIPTSEKFYEGTESNLRGYSFLTVSPLNDRYKPVGGRSMLIFATELRMRISETFGVVTFYDFGNVYANPIPELNHKILQSIGSGLRYHTPVGPLRLDVAFPLNPRYRVDKRFQIYLSIGQAF